MAARLPSDAVPRGAVVPVEVDGHELVVWRARTTGALCAMTRQCPHLDWDLAEAWVEEGELVCPGHGWSFDTEGHACKRNLLGRADPKDDVTIVPVDERDGEITVGSRVQPAGAVGVDRTRRVRDRAPEGETA